MSPTLHDGERVIAFSPWSKHVFKRNHIVVLSHFHIEVPKQIKPSFQFSVWKEEMARTHSDYFIKRIIGLPNDIIYIPLSEITPYMLGSVDPNARMIGNNYMWNIPKNHVFLRSENIVGYDSTVWGPIPISSLRQIVLCRYPSLRRIR